MSRSEDASPEITPGSRILGSSSMGPSASLERIDRLLRPWRPARPRVLVVADQDDWLLSFRSLSLRRDFVPFPIVFDWFREPVGADFEPWFQRCTAVCIWHWGTLSADQIQRAMDRGRVLSPGGIHFVAASRWQSIDRLHWTRLGASGTLQNPEDLWSYRRMVQSALRQTNRSGTGSKGAALGGRLPRTH